MGSMRTNKMAVVVLLLATAAIKDLDETTYVVGNLSGWSQPPSGSETLYFTWASNNTFVVGDVLVFNFVTGMHDVATVTKEAYDNCDTSNTTSLETNGPANYSLPSDGLYYFICSFSGHCSGGLKLAINVVTSSSGSVPTISPVPPPKTALPPGVNPPSPSGSASPLAATFCVVLSVAIAFFIYDILSPNTL